MPYWQIHHGTANMDIDKKKLQYTWAKGSFNSQLTHFIPYHHKKMHTYWKISIISFVGHTIFFSITKDWKARGLLFKRIFFFCFLPFPKIFSASSGTTSRLHTYLLVLQEKICQEEDTLCLSSSYVNLLQFHNLLTSHLAGVTTKKYLPTEHLTREKCTRKWGKKACKNLPARKDEEIAFLLCVIHSMPMCTIHLEDSILDAKHHHTWNLKYIRNWYINRWVNSRWRYLSWKLRCIYKEA